MQYNLRGIKDARVQDVMTLENENIRHDFTIIDEWCRNVWETKKYSNFPKTIALKWTCISRAADLPL
jgi:hypothetical protein